MDREKEVGRVDKEVLLERVGLEDRTEMALIAGRPPKGYQGFCIYTP